MARFDLFGLSTVSSATTHAVGVVPRVVLALTGTTAVTNTTQAGLAAVGVGWTVSSVAPQPSVSYISNFSNSSARSSVNGRDDGMLQSRDTSGDPQVGSLTDLESTMVGLTAPFRWPSAILMLGGSELESDVSTFVAVSTVTSTQASTGYGFPPNAAIVLGQSFVSSVANFSFGFACVDTAGNRSQWSIGQSGREAAAANAHKTASTVNCLKLVSTATTAASTRHYEAAVTSFKADGLELTVNATDTARAATVSILGLSVPKANAGKATITTNGAGAGQTGFTVSGIGQNVGLVILASIGSSLQTVQADNYFSIGFASSNGNQRSVAGLVGNGGGAASYGSYFNTTRAVTFFANDTNCNIASVGLFALATASSGFTVTFNNTVANGWDVYWAALSNVVTDIGASIQSSFTVNAGPKLVQRIGAAIASSFMVQAGPKEVGHLGGSIQAAFTEALGLTPDFIPGAGKINGLAELRTYIWRDVSVGMGRGQTEEATDRHLVVQKNSSSPDLVRSIDLTTDRVRLGVAEFGNAEFLVICPPSTNQVPFRIAAGRSGAGMPLSSVGMNVFTLADRGGSDVYLYSTEAGTTIHDVRILLA